MESRRLTFNCSGCSYSTKRSYNLKRHLTNEHSVADNIPNKEARQLGDGLPRPQRNPIPEKDGLYTEEEYEENMSAIRKRFPTMNFEHYRSEILCTRSLPSLLVHPVLESQCSVCDSYAMLGYVLRRRPNV